MASQWFKPTGPEVAVFAAFDDAMQAFMTQANVRGGTLALIKEGRLVYARGYTYDAPQTLPIEPTSLFSYCQLYETTDESRHLSVDRKSERSNQIQFREPHRTNGKAAVAIACAPRPAAST